MVIRSKLSKVSYYQGHSQSLGKIIYTAITKSCKEVMLKAFSVNIFQNQKTVAREDCILQRFYYVLWLITYGLTLEY